MPDLPGGPWHGDFALVAFDCDGVLVDSEPITNRVLAQMLAEEGLALSLDDMYAQFIGNTMADSLREAERRLGRPLSPGFTDAYVARSRAVLAQEVRAVPGIEAALDAIDCRVCVGSNGLRGKMDITLGVTGLLPRFVGRIFCAEDVAHGKPAPDLYLHAARSLGVAPADCAVVEDTPTGIRAGVAAGMTVLGFSAHLAAERLREAGAHACFDRMEELPRLLRELPSRRQCGRAG